MAKFMDPSMQPAGGGGGGVDPWSALGGGVAGYGTATAVQYVKNAHSYAKWGLGISLGVTALMLLAGSNLQNDQQNAVNVGIAANAIAITASAPTAADVANVRMQVVALSNVVAMVAYHANIFNWFTSAPPQQTVIVPAATGGFIGPVAAVQQTSNNNNNNIVIVLIIALGIGAFALAG